MTASLSFEIIQIFPLLYNLFYRLVLRRFQNLFDRSTVKFMVKIRRVTGMNKVSPNLLDVGDRSFSFDYVVDSSLSQEDVFKLAGVITPLSCQVNRINGHLLMM